jgi:hypothetical protein
VTEGDWRLTNQEEYLKGATLVWKPYHAWSETWEHDHCEFCWRKFVESNGLTAGFAAQGTGPQGQDDYHWICETCADDFCARFRWTLVRD